MKWCWWHSFTSFREGRAVTLRNKLTGGKFEAHVVVCTKCKAVRYEPFFDVRKLEIGDIYEIEESK